MSEHSEFRNWLNGEYKAEFIRACHKVQAGEMTPELLRHYLQIAFLAGDIQSTRSAMQGLQAVARSFSLQAGATAQADPVSLSTGSADLTTGDAA